MWFAILVCPVFVSQNTDWITHFIMKSQELEQLCCVAFMARMYVSLKLC